MQYLHHIKQRKAMLPFCREHRFMFYYVIESLPLNHSSPRLLACDHRSSSREYMASPIYMSRARK